MEEKTIEQLLLGMTLHDERVVDCLHKIEVYIVRRVARGVAERNKRKFTMTSEPFNGGYYVTIFREK